MDMEMKDPGRQVSPAARKKNEQKYQARSYNTRRRGKTERSNVRSCRKDDSTTILW